jgi:hypothetical protein
MKMVIGGEKSYEAYTYLFKWNFNTDESCLLK